MNEQRPKRSDQLPEEAPADQVPDDTAGSPAKSQDERAESSRPGPPSRPQAMGHPDNAG